MAEKAVVQDVRYALRVSEEELAVIQEALRRLYHSESGSWVTAGKLLTDFAEGF
ncbi:hypothetical protein [Streptomyces globisporus]|uniref:hypothetical protein n=1 Tax=Streptomyces globisporus TaxID=1908 RepID=UPI0036BDD841